LSKTKSTTKCLQQVLSRKVAVLYLVRTCYRLVCDGSATCRRPAKNVEILVGELVVSTFKAG